MSNTFAALGVVTSGGGDLPVPAPNISVLVTAEISNDPTQYEQQIMSELLASGLVLDGFSYASGVITLQLENTSNLDQGTILSNVGQALLDATLEVPNNIIVANSTSAIFQGAPQPSTQTVGGFGLGTQIANAISNVISNVVAAIKKGLSFAATAGIWVIVVVAVLAFVVISVKA